jgi:hypothetical protein
VLEIERLDQLDDPGIDLGTVTHNILRNYLACALAAENGEMAAEGGAMLTVIQCRISALGVAK